MKSAGHIPPHLGESRHVLARIETPSVKVEEMEYAPGFCAVRHSHDTANFVYILEGAHWSGYSRGGDTCVPQTVRFLPAGEPHENYFPVGSKCLHIELRLPILKLASAEGPVLQTPGEVASPWAPVLGAQLHREFRQRDNVARVALEGLSLQLLLAGARPKPLRRTQIPPWLLRVREMLQEHGTGDLTLEDLSRCAGRHPVQVSRQFHHHFGCTISGYVRQLRIARAQVLLARRDLSIAEIALASGFSDQSHFANAFRRLTGTCPLRYRLRNSKAGS